MKFAASQTTFLLGYLSVLGFMGCSNLVKGERQYTEQQAAVRIEQQNGETKVVCVLPSLTFDKLPFVVQEVVVRDASGDPLPASHEYRQSMVSFVAPDDELAKVTIDVLYIDASALQWDSTDAVDEPDWQIRFRQFKLIDALNSGAFTKSGV